MVPHSPTPNLFPLLLLISRPTTTTTRQSNHHPPPPGVHQGGLQGGPGHRAGGGHRHLPRGAQVRQRRHRHHLQLPQGERSLTRRGFGSSGEGGHAVSVSPPTSVHPCSLVAPHQPSTHPPAPLPPLFPRTRPGDLRVRPARGGVRLQGHDPVGEPPPQPGTPLAPPPPPHPYRTSPREQIIQAQCTHN